jgi:hypothetical protein
MSRAILGRWGLPDEAAVSRHDDGRLIEAAGGFAQEQGAA